jgi:hypothetical protein
MIISIKSKEKPINHQEMLGAHLNKEIIRLLVRYLSKMAIGRTVWINLERRTHSY